MFKTLRISFALQNTYRVNAILYSLKQVPLLRRILPASLYRVKGFKILANILAAIWELITVFGGKAVYFALLFYSMRLLHSQLPGTQVFLHLLLFLSLVGGLINTSLFEPTKAQYYAVMLLGMDAKAYTLTAFFYTMAKVAVGFLPCTLVAGGLVGVPLWLCVLLPLCVVAIKFIFAWWMLWKHRHWNGAEKMWPLRLAVIALLLAAAYGLPALGVALPPAAVVAFFALCLPVGAAAAAGILRFDGYRPICRELLLNLSGKMDAGAANALKQASEKNISADGSITSRKKGFEYLNELFIKRHRRILWKATEKITLVCGVLAAATLLLMQFIPAAKPVVNQFITTQLPMFAFVMYSINRGTSFTQALFMNCDHSLLTYSFYKRRDFVLRLFQIRLWEIAKINGVPALVIGGGLALLLWASGGTGQPVYYLILPVAVLCMSGFFSIHYLTLYYLLQPYNAGTQLKSGTYKVAMAATYCVCYIMLQIKMSILVFGVSTILFCLIYGLVASVLVYRLAPKTFRIRN